MLLKEITSKIPHGTDWAAASAQKPMASLVACNTCDERTNKQFQMSTVRCECLSILLCDLF